MIEIPEEVKNIIIKLESRGFEAYVVGGPVRDLLMKKIPKDWDIATNAKPEEIQKLFPRNFYDNKFGTVSVITDSKNEAIKIIQITTYRYDGMYTDMRHPDKIRFVSTINDDLARRDFTINAMALKTKNFSFAKSAADKSTDKTTNYEIIDPFDGQDDIIKKIIRTVGIPDERFKEDALRMMRAIRFAVMLRFKIEPKTFAAIKNNAKNLEIISKERISEEFQKIILSQNPAGGIELMRESGLLRYVIPELEKGIGISQNRHHIYTIYEHSALSLKHCPSQKLEVRLASLFHDIAKPETKRGKGPDATFYNHDIVSAKVVKNILQRLKFPRTVIEKTAHLIRNHMFFYNVDEVSEAGVRRLISRVGYDNMKDLIDLRIADRLGSGVPKAKPYKLRHLEYLIEKVKRAPISASMLKVDGNDVIKTLNVKPGPIIGAVLAALLAEVLENPELNKKSLLKKRISELGLMSMEELKAMAKVIEEKKEEVELKEKKKFRVK